MKNNLFLVHQTKALRDVQYKSLESKLSEIQESIDKISNTRKISDVYEQQIMLLTQKYEHQLKQSKIKQ